MTRSASPQVLPTLSGRSLDGEDYQFPRELRRRFGILVLAFRREQQEIIDDWLPWLLALERRRSDVAVCEVPVISTAYRPVRRFIDGGMARGVGTDDARARTVTVYTDVRRLISDLGLRGSDTIALLLVERSGRILATELGSFEEEKAKRLAGPLPSEP